METECEATVCYTEGDFFDDYYDYYDDIRYGPDGYAIIIRYGPDGYAIRIRLEQYGNLIRNEKIHNEEITKTLGKLIKLAHPKELFTEGVMEYFEKYYLRECIQSKCYRYSIRITMANLVVDECISEGVEPRSGTEGNESEVEEKRESLAILACLGTTKEYIGIQATLGDIKKLSVKDVEKYYNRYHAFLGKQVTGGLVESSIRIVTQVISALLPIDNSEELFKDLNSDEL